MSQKMTISKTNTYSTIGQYPVYSIIRQHKLHKDLKLYWWFI